MIINLNNDFIVYSFILVSILIINTYLIYPIFISLLSLFKKNKTKRKDYAPNISILIAAYNEEKVIYERIKNIASQNYDFSKIELLIGSDASSDKTNEILKSVEKRYPWFKVFTYHERRGKAGVLNNLIKAASNEILLFTDANTVFDNNAISKLVRNFDDSKVGGVCGKLVLTDEHIDERECVEEAKYWQFETMIKTIEGKLGILIGANGGNFAIRNTLATYLPLDQPITDDLFLSINVLIKGAKFVYEPESIATEDVGESIEIEIKRKIRFASTNFQTLALSKSLLFNKNVLLSYAYWSHKFLRWIFPILMLFLLLFSIILFEYGLLYKIVLSLQLLFYSSTFLGFLFSKMKIRIPMFSMSYFFFVSNVALVKGLVRFLQGRHSVIWESTKR